MNQKLKRIMILSGTYIVLMTVLLIGVSTAKYTESSVAYSSFGTAGFNVLLLGSDSAGGSVQQFGRTLLASDLVPGMEYTGISETNTAEIIPFKVANGTSAEDAAEIALDYTVKLRTTRNLPLSFKLLLGSTVYRANTPVPLDKNGTPVADGTPELDTNGIAWYEWTFRDIANEADGSVEQSTAPVFSLYPGGVHSNSHSLVVEWPVTVDAESGTAQGNSTDYMKEIELLEVRIQATQKNDTTLDPEDITEKEARDYSKGFIVLDPEQETQIYEVDYRAMKRCTLPNGEDGWSYDFVIDNGVAGGAQPTEESVQYRVSLIAPVMWGGEEYFGTSYYRYYLWKEERTAGQPYGTGNLIPCCRKDEVYYKVDQETGNREDYTEWFTSSGCDDPEFRQMVLEANGKNPEFVFIKEQRYSGEMDPEADSSEMKAAEYGEEAVFTLENKVTADDTLVSVSASDKFHLEVYDHYGRQSFPAYLQLNRRLQIVIERVNGSAEITEDEE